MMHCHFLQILVLVGMKLEVVIMEMAEKIQDETAIVKGMPVIEPSNQFFWFNRPRWILFLIHFTLFQVTKNRLTSGFRKIDHHKIHNQTMSRRARRLLKRGCWCRSY